MIEHKEVLIDLLIVNPENDRHGILNSEKEAVEWLLKNKKDAMRALAKDIAEQGRLYEAPLIKSNGNGKFTVFDGNRRVTCLKLLFGLFDDYGLEDIDYYKNLRTEFDCLKNIQRQISCDVSDDQDEIDTIVLRRHAPTKSGEKRLSWGPNEKENFLERTGRSEKINFAKKVQDLLHERGFLNKNEIVKNSIFNRLFSSNFLRGRVGLKLSGNKIYFLIENQEKILKALSYIARLINTGEITLNKVWSNSLKNSFLDGLETLGLLPTAQEKIDFINKEMENPYVYGLDEDEDAQNEQQRASKKTSTKNKTTPLNGTSALPRRNILPPHLEMPKHGKNVPAKLQYLFLELQYDLDVEKHLISASISFRVLIELLTHAYASKHKITFSENERLSSKIDRVYKTFPADFQTDNSTFLKNLSQKNSYFSTGTMNAFVHSTDSLPIAADVIRFADNFEKYISGIVKDLNSK